MTDEWRNEVNKNSFGGTELEAERLFKEFGEQLENFQIIPTRVRELKEDKIRVLWVHDLEEDPECKHLENGGWSKFHKIVFVSYHQQNNFIRKFGIPPSHTTVIQNSIVPIDVVVEDKPKDRINLVYFSNPIKGLGLLVPIFKKLHEEFGDKIHLNCYSSFRIYGWEERDKNFQPLYDEILNHPGMSYYGTVSNDDIREVLKTQHIYAHPSTFAETSCRCLMESMSAGLLCVHSSLGALPETAANWTMMYDYHENPQTHAQHAYEVLRHAVKVIDEKNPISELKTQKSYADMFYSWNLRKLQWAEFLKLLEMQWEGKDLSIQKPQQYFTWGAG